MACFIFFLVSHNTQQVAAFGMRFYHKVRLLGLLGGWGFG